MFRQPYVNIYIYMLYILALVASNRAVSQQALLPGIPLLSCCNSLGVGLDGCPYPFFHWF